ncbi:hypothetical protein SAMN05444414_10184 [Roseovarius marisflavi]|uniref:DUF2059 domain-containing protein n=1 Tax=Roseovarius marisflavi TaxID=1054996 RepID=A0A1M6V419_9RHOB|nr:hypothetical protein [Roseovarius marisflavi]SHK76056.1 hypothetical protein SAMN05444414_10184 [Roseovarius marisflavi]
MRNVMFGLALATLPALVQAQTVSSDRIEAFVAVMAENGCRMSPHRANVIMPEAGFDDMAETKAITERLVEEERARIMDGQLVVFGGACGGKLDYSGRERFFAALADNNCVMTTEQAPTLLGRVGVEMAEVRLLMEKMLRMSEVRLSEDEKAVYLEQGLCDTFKGLSAGMVNSAPTLKAAPRSAGQLRQDFLAFMVTEGCSMTRGEADNKLPAAGFSVKEMRPVIGKMLAEGEAVMDTDADTLTINKELCAQ